MKLTLRDYQVAQCSAVYREARAGRGRTVINSPVGSGKSAVIAELCRRAKKPLVISPALSVLDQLSANLSDWLGEFVDVEQGFRRVSGNSMMRSRVIMASRNSLLSRSRYRRSAFNDRTLVVFDECHIGMTPPMMEMLEWFEGQGAYVVGLSATPYKGKGKPLPWWSRPCYAYSMIDAIRDGWLVRPRGIMTAASSLDLRVVEDAAGEWNQSQLAAVLNDEQVVHEVANLVMQTFRGQPSAVYCQNIQQAKLLAEVIERWGYTPALVYSGQQPEDRKAHMEAFRDGHTNIICNVNVLAYGWDHPRLKNIYNAAPTRSLPRYEQRIGRGTRPLKGILQPGMTKGERLAAIADSDKPFFTIYDITDSSSHIQLVNALDVIDAKARENPKRRAKNNSGMSEEVDLLQEVDRRDEEETFEQQLAKAEMEEKRRKLIVGYTFDHSTRDLFSAPENGRSRRGWRMLWGKYKGELLRDLPTGFLQHVADGIRKQTPFKNAVQREIRDRQESAA